MMAVATDECESHKNLTGSNGLFLENWNHPKFASSCIATRL
jgi:hypothetical protein